MRSQRQGGWFVKSSHNTLRSHTLLLLEVGQTGAGPGATAKLHRDVIANLVGGRWIRPDGPSLPIYDPATGEVIEQVPLSGREAVGDAVEAAGKAYAGWSRTPVMERVRLMFRFKALLEEGFEDLARIITRHHGKTLEEARGEVRRGIEVVDFACGAPTLLQGRTLRDVSAGVDQDLYRFPLGVVAGVPPFNFPVMIPLWMFPLAVVAGNTFILKPSERTPLGALRLAEIFTAAGFPDGVLNLVNGAGAEVEALIADPGVAAISFVGSAPVARQVYMAAAANGKRVQALGGAKNHIVVMPDADLDIAVPAILVVSATLGWWLAWRAVGPIQLITRVAREIAEGGDLSRRISLKGRDELSQLAATFDHMMERLEGAFQRQREFTADASHELRTPVTIIGLEANRALAHERTAGEYRAALETIRAENDRMGRLVADLLTLARSDTAEVQLGREDLDLSELVLEAVERLGGLARTSGIAQVVGQLPELTVNGDRGYLQQLITNLLENAVKYTAGVGDRVAVSAGQRAADGMEIAWVKIADNGPGIPGEYLSRLFDRFYRVSSSRSQNSEDAAGGHGLGLAIARLVALAHHGDITVQSTVGRGCTFEVTLPPAESAAAESRNRAS